MALEIPLRKSYLVQKSISLLGHLLEWIEQWLENNFKHCHFIYSYLQKASFKKLAWVQHIFNHNLFHYYH